MVENAGFSGRRERERKRGGCKKRGLESRIVAAGAGKKSEQISGGELPRIEERKQMEAARRSSDGRNANQRRKALSMTARPVPDKFGSQLRGLSSKMSGGGEHGFVVGIHTSSRSRSGGNGLRRWNFEGGENQDRLSEIELRLVSGTENCGMTPIADSVSESRSVRWITGDGIVRLQQSPFHIS
jgi:hypothetical protein